MNYSSFPIGGKIGLLGLLWFLGFGAIQAQPTIQLNPTLVDLGESAEVQFALGSTDPGPSGSNVTWDFSNLQNDGTPFSWSALSSVGTTYQDSFPLATHLYQALSQDGNTEFFHFYHLDGTSNTWNYDGSVNLTNSGQDTVFHLLNSDPKGILSFPFTFNDAFTDSFSGMSHISVGGNAFSQSRSGSTTVTADGFGTLQTPAGSFSNVLRVHTVETLTDMFMGFPTSQQTIHRWSWYAENEKYLLLHIDSIVVQPTSGPATTTISMFYRNSTITSVEPGAETLSFTCYPNPARDRLTVQSAKGDLQGTTILVTDLTGKTVRTYSPFRGDRADLSLQGLVPGIYLLRISSPEGLHTQKIIVQ